MDVCQKLKDADITPFAFPNATIGDLSWLWFNNSVCSQMDPGIVDELDVSGNGYVELTLRSAREWTKEKIDFTDENLKSKLLS